MTSTTQTTVGLWTGNWLPVALAGVAALASLAAAVGGGTLARLTLTIALPMAVGVWIHTVRQSRPPALVVAVLVLLVLAGSIHVVLTSPFAAWAVDSHMVPAALLPSAAARIAVAWTVPVLWLAVFAAMAVTGHRRVGTPMGPLLVGAGLAPLLVGNAFPTDSYRLLWESTALGHPSYATGACAILLVMVLAHVRTGQRPVVTEAP